jgi:hypothetical protein
MAAEWLRKSQKTTPTPINEAKERELAISLSAASD